MKTKLGISSVILAAVCGTMQAPAQNTVTDSPYGQYHLGKLEKANKIIGMEIKDAQDQRLGKVEDLAVDLKNGRIVEVIVGTGGVLGVDEQLKAVPPGQFTCDPDKKALDLNVDKARFTEAPSFKRSEWRAEPANVTEVYSYYGVQPYFMKGDVQTETVTPTHPAEAQKAAMANKPCYLGKVQRASKLIGSSVHNMQNERIGKVENLTVDLRGGRVVEVVLASGGFLGMGDELSAVPPQAFHMETEPAGLSLDTTKEALANAPHFKSSDWSSVNNPDQVVTVYHAYNVEPNFDVAADNTAQNVRDRSDDALTPLKQGTSAADVDATRQIRKQIMAEKGFSISAHNVKIITLDGRVTLRGAVKSQEEKRRIGEIAAQVVSAANVDNQLQVAPYSPTSSAN
jgi:sporulation protein YlmC with PRC-barrel domain